MDSFSALEILSPAMQRFTEAKWKITMTFKGDGVDPFTIPSIFMFPLRDGMFDFGDPCDNPSKKFGAAFANLIKILYKHPSFTNINLILTFVQFEVSTNSRHNKSSMSSMWWWMEVMAIMKVSRWIWQNKDCALMGENNIGI